MPLELIMINLDKMTWHMIRILVEKSQDSVEQQCLNI